MDSPAPLLVRLSILPPVLLLVAVVAHGGFGLGRDTTPLIHSLRNAQACVECHEDAGEYRLDEPVTALCAQCHAWAELSSRRGHSAETTLAEDCASCHDAHGRTDEPFLLRPTTAVAGRAANREP